MNQKVCLAATSSCISPCTACKEPCRRWQEPSLTIVCVNCLLADTSCKISEQRVPVLRVIGWRSSLHTTKWPIRPELILISGSTKCLWVFLYPLDGMVVHQKAAPGQYLICQSVRVKWCRPRTEDNIPGQGSNPNSSIQRWGRKPWGHHSSHYMHKKTLDRGSWMQIGMQSLACVPSCGSMTNSSVSFLHLPQECLWSHNSTCTNKLTIIENS